MAEIQSVLEFQIQVVSSLLNSLKEQKTNMHLNYRK